MRLLLWLVALMAAAIGIAVTARFNPGNVVFFYPPHRIDLSLNLFVVLAALLFLVLYVLARAVRATLDMPVRLRYRYSATPKRPPSAPPTCPRTRASPR